jgi:PKD repeat protein
LVSLSAVNDYTGPEGNTDTDNALFIVCSAPLTGLRFSPLHATAGVSVILTASLTPADVLPPPSVEWSFGATGLQATTLFEAPGSYMVTVTATNACDQVVYGAAIEVAPAEVEEFFLYVPVVRRD